MFATAITRLIFWITLDHVFPSNSIMCHELYGLNPAGEVWGQTRQKWRSGFLSSFVLWLLCVIPTSMWWLTSCSHDMHSVSHNLQTKQKKKESEHLVLSEKSSALKERCGRTFCSFFYFLFNIPNWLMLHIKITFHLSSFIFLSYYFSPLGHWVSIHLIFVII